MILSALCKQSLLDVLPAMRGRMENDLKEWPAEAYGRLETATMEIMADNPGVTAEGAGLIMWCKMRDRPGYIPATSIWDD